MSGRGGSRPCCSPPRRGDGSPVAQRPVWVTGKMLAFILSEAGAVGGWSGGGMASHSGAPRIPPVPCGYEPGSREAGEEVTATPE